MAERDRLQGVAAHSRDSEMWRHYKAVRNKINSRLVFEERNWQRSRITECGQNPAKVWKNVKNIIHWKSSGAPSRLFYDGTLHTKPVEVAKCQNLFFLNKVNTYQRINATSYF